MAAEPHTETSVELSHELNNSVGVVLQLAHLARRGVDDGSQAAADLDLLVAESERLAKMLARPPTVLVVEDDPTMRALVERTLTDTGLAVIAAGSVGEALAALAGSHARVDLVLTDLGVPGLAGDDLPAALASAGEKPPVVVMSGSDSAGVPASAHLPKPFRPDELVTAVRDALGGATGRAD